MRAEIVGEVQLGGRAGLGTNLGAGEFERRGHAERLFDHETLAVVIDHAGEHQAERGVARHGPGRVARQDVDVPRLQRGEALLGVETGIFDLGRIVEDRRGERAAEVNVESLPGAVLIFGSKAEQARINAALHESLRFDIFQRTGTGRGSAGQHGGAGDDGCDDLLHCLQPSVLVGSFDPRRRSAGRRLITGEAIRAADRSIPVATLAGASQHSQRGEPSGPGRRLTRSSQAIMAGGSSAERRFMPRLRTFLRHDEIRAS